ncbi:MAG TPA: class I SAM-dependent methyltransferase [Gemmatimonadaceae bacterium]|nr:class I SAM-dependent methyltransferase [Gemmatimonadaceae bacterium]
MTASNFTYSGTELEAVAEAKNYYNWIIDSFAGRIGSRAVEAGAGIGTVSSLILQRANPRQLTLIEPDASNAAALRQRFHTDARVIIHQGYLEQFAASLDADSVVAVNVLEHVERDADFLRAAHDAVRPGGSLLLLVPALPAIFGSLDRAFDHFRRYTRSGLAKQLQSSGFEIETLHYLNILGVAAWFASGRIMRRTTLGRGQVRFYDRYVIPTLREIETRFHPPIGQSLLAIARKRDHI